VRFLYADTFKGEILHSTGYKRAIDLQGKKVDIIGACTSGSYFFLFVQLDKIIAFSTRYRHEYGFGKLSSVSTEASLTYFFFQT